MIEGGREGDAKERDGQTVVEWIQVLAKPSGGFLLSRLPCGSPMTLAGYGTGWKEGSTYLPS